MQHPDLYLSSPQYCHYYFDLVTTDNLVLALQESKQHCLQVFSQISPEKENYAYDPGKWTTKEVLRHIIETDRILSYRALRFSRFDANPLPGFNENAYIENTRDMQYSMQSVLKEFESLRESIIQMYIPMTDEMLQFKGTANGLQYSPLALGFMVAGHTLHHCKVLQERY
jgi:hypothetical protein